MKLDFMIYGRGEERGDGYKLHARPAYFTDDMLMALDGYFNMWRANEKHDYENMDKVRYEWGHTYLFIAMPDPYCCALLRCIPVEGDKAGVWLMDSGRSPIWSMEGLCCHFNDKDLFWAMVPSMILWMESIDFSLYAGLKRGIIGKSAEIPDKLLYNPYSDIIPDESQLAVLKDDCSKDALLDLIGAICFSVKPYNFIFGPLADWYKERIGNDYGISEAFSTVRSSDHRRRDPFENIKIIEQREVSEKKTVYDLVFINSAEKKDAASWRWGLREKSETAGSAAPEIILGSAIPFDPEKGVSAFELMAEADTVVGFAQRMGWRQADTFDKKYTFIKEG